MQYFQFYKRERESVCVCVWGGGVREDRECAHWCVSVFLSVLIICFFISALRVSCCGLSVAALVTMALMSINLCR